MKVIHFIHGASKDTSPIATANDHACDFSLSSILSNYDQTEVKGVQSILRVSLSKEAGSEVEPYSGHQGMVDVAIVSHDKSATGTTSLSNFNLTVAAS